MIALFSPHQHTNMLTEQNLTHTHSLTPPRTAGSSVANSQVRAPENRGETQILKHRGARRGATVLRIEVTTEGLFLLSQLRN